MVYFSVRLFITLSSFHHMFFPFILIMKLQNLSNVTPLCDDPKTQNVLGNLKVPILCQYNPMNVNYANVAFILGVYNLFKSSRKLILHM